MAIGEVGLDFFHIKDLPDKDTEIIKQKKTFLQQLSLAVVVGKPLVVHCRDAYKELADILTDVDPNFKGAEHLRKLQADGSPGTLHCFTGTWEEAKRFVDLGFCVGFTGIITFPARKSNPDAQAKLLEAVKNVPLSQLLVETDAPYLAGGIHRGKRAEPWMGETVLEKMSVLRGQSIEILAKATEENAKKLFRIV